MTFYKITESPSKYDNLEHRSTRALLNEINSEDHSAPAAVALCIPQIETLVDGIVDRLNKGGRVFYIGAGTSGRLGILDASECPPTFGVPEDMFIGIIAGGDGAIRKAVEFAEDDKNQGWSDLKKYGINDMDVVIGLAASGTTPYVIGALESARNAGLLTSCITCNPGSPITKSCEIPIVAEVGSEYVTGSTRMKSGTAQKLILNMISTASLIRFGRVKGNRMVDMQLSNNKLWARAKKIVSEQLSIPEAIALDLLKKYGSVRAVLENESHQQNK
ncbi:MAG: N-acetylmuramic acid 6-phosphate etherase [Cryomorphaceae bacterium]|nr:N-acetylmuramic acid 6-phosphate etherase [Cryomorphaceae bacterium]